MTVKVLAFGVAKEIFEAASIKMEVNDEMVTVDRLKNLLQQNYPRLQQLSSYMIAVNNEYAGGGQMLYATDEIAVIPPVSGG